MKTFFMNTKNSKTNQSNLSIYYTWKNILKSYNNNKFKISAPTWNKTFDLPDASYSVASIHDDFEYIV